MHAKKLLAVGVMALSLTLLAGCGSAQPGTTTDDNVISGTTETTTVETTTPSNLTTNEQCIEMMAYALKGAEYLTTKDMATFYVWATKLADLQKKYGISEKEYEDVCNSMVVDFNFMEKVQKRMTELK